MDNPNNDNNKLLTMINNKCETCKHYNCICAIKQKIMDIKNSLNPPTTLSN